MNRKISIAEAKNRLPAIVHDVEKGTGVQLTRYGKPVAVLLSTKEYDRLCRFSESKRFWKDLVDLRIEMASEGVEFTDHDFNGLRDRSTGRDVEL